MPTAVKAPRRPRQPRKQANTRTNTPRLYALQNFSIVGATLHAQIADTAANPLLLPLTDALIASGPILVTGSGNKAIVSVTWDAADAELVFSFGVTPAATNELVFPQWWPAIRMPDGGWIAPINYTLPGE